MGNVVRAAVKADIEKTETWPIWTVSRSEMSKVSYSFAIIEDPDGNMIELVEYHRLAAP